MAFKKVRSAHDAASSVRHRLLVLYTNIQHLACKASKQCHPTRISTVKMVTAPSTV
jgi:hypothetical protein